MHSIHVGSRVPTSTRHTLGCHQAKTVRQIARLQSRASPDPDTAKSAIQYGLSLYEAKDYAAAQEIFRKAVDLPGTGLKQFRDKPAVASNGERQAALYNVACCCSQQGDLQAGLSALAQCLEGGYEGFRQIRTDEDLKAVREDPRFEKLMQRYEKQKGGSGFFGTLIDNFRNPVK